MKENYYFLCYHFYYFSDFFQVNIMVYCLCSTLVFDVPQLCPYSGKDVELLEVSVDRA